MPTLSDNETKSFTEEMERVHHDFKERASSGKFLDEEEVSEKFPDIMLTDKHYHMSDVEFTSRRKQILHMAEMRDAQSRRFFLNHDKALGILQENDRLNGSAHKAFSCQLTLLEQAEKACQQKGDHVGVGTAVAMKSHFIKNKSAEQKKYEETFRALEKAYEISSPMGAPTMFEEGRTYIEREYPNVISNQVAVEAHNDVRDLKENIPTVVLDDVYNISLETKRRLEHDISAMTREEAMQRVANCAVAECESFANMVAGRITAVAPNFDWTKTVFIGEQTLHDRTTEVMKEKKIASNLRSLVTSSVLSSAVMNQNKHIYIPDFNSVTKRFEDNRLIKIEPKGLNRTVVAKNPKMNPWQRFWSHFGRYKDTLQSQKEFELQQKIKEKIQPLNNEIQGEINIAALKAKLPQIINKANFSLELGNTVYDKVDEQNKQNLTDGDRIMASGMLVAKLMLDKDMPIERALDPKISAIEKDDVADEIAAILNPSYFYVKRWNLVMLGAELLLSNKPKFDLKNGLFAADGDLTNIAFQGKYLEQLAINMHKEKYAIKDWFKDNPDKFPAFRNDNDEKKFEKLTDLISMTSKLYKGMADGYVMIAKNAPYDSFKLKGDDKEHIDGLSNALFVKNVANLRNVDIASPTNDLSLFTQNVANSKDFEEIAGLKDLTLMKTTTVNKLSNMAQAITSRVTASAGLPKEAKESCMVVMLEKDLANPQPRLAMPNLTEKRNDTNFNVDCDYTPLELWEPMIMGVAASKKEREDAIVAAAAFARLNPNTDKAAAYDAKVEKLLDAIFLPEDKEFLDRNKGQTHLRPLNATVAYLTTKYDMTVKEILDENYRTDLKKEARKDILDLYGHGDDNSIPAMTETSARLLANRPAQNYVKGSQEVRDNYDELRLSADFHDNFRQLRYHSWEYLPSRGKLEDAYVSEAVRKFIPKDYNRRGSYYHGGDVLEYIIIEGMKTQGENLKLLEPLTEKEASQIEAARKATELAAAEAKEKAFALANPNADKAKAYDEKVKDLIDTVFQGEFQTALNFYNKRGNLAPVNATIAYLTTQENMSIEEILDKEFKTDVKKGARAAIIGLYDKLDDKPYPPMTETAIKFLTDKPGASYVKGSQAVRDNYDEIRLKADFCENFAELYNKQGASFKIEECCKSEANRAFLPEDYNKNPDPLEPTPAAHYVMMEAQRAGIENHKILAPLDEKEIAQLKEARIAAQSEDDELDDTISSTHTTSSTYIDNEEFDTATHTTSSTHSSKAAAVSTSTAAVSKQEDEANKAPEPKPAAAAAVVAAGGRHR